jgi:hypothetical protein
VGFPIRKFSSFIASQRQGIHQIPLRHLIALIANARRSVEPSLSILRSIAKTLPIRLGSLRTLALVRSLGGVGLLKRPVLLQTHPGVPAVKPEPTTEMLSRPRRANGPNLAIEPFSRHSLSTECVSSSRCQIILASTPKRAAKLYFQRTISLSKLQSVISRSTVWWSQTGSNRRPHACKARALPTELWPRAGRLAATAKPRGLARSEATPS